MHTFAKRLKNLRNNKNQTQKELALALNIQRDALASWEIGRSTPDYDTLVMISDYFEVTVDYLLGKPDIKNTGPTNQVEFNLLKLPILGTIRAGLPILAEEHIDDYLELPDYMCGDFVLHVQGDSMIGVGILDGDLAICKYSEEPQTGQIVVARKDVSVEYSEATLKFYFNGNGKPVLRAANPNYPDIDYHSERYTTAGRVVAIVRRDAPGYELYTDFLSVKDNEEWTEVIEVAAANGLVPQDLISLVNINLKMIKRLKG